MKKKAEQSLIAVGIIWAIYILDLIIPFDINSFGIVPRTVHGLIGIVFSPFLHAGLGHIISNTIPLFVLLFTLLYFYEDIAVQVVISIILIGGILVWIFARSANHIGASGLIFGLVSFLIASGIFRKSFKSILISVVIFFLYGGVIWGILPTQPWISWEGHLFGLIAGIIMAYVLKNAQIRENSTTL